MCPINNQIIHPMGRKVNSYVQSSPKRNRLTRDISLGVSRPDAGQFHAIRKHSQLAGDVAAAWARLLWNQLLVALHAGLGAGVDCGAGQAVELHDSLHRRAEPTGYGAQSGA